MSDLEACREDRGTRIDHHQRRLLQSPRTPPLGPIQLRLTRIRIAAAALTPPDVARPATHRQEMKSEGRERGAVSTREHQNRGYSHAVSPDEQPRSIPTNKAR